MSESAGTSKERGENVGEESKKVGNVYRVLVIIINGAEDLRKEATIITRCKLTTKTRSCLDTWKRSMMIF